MTKLYDNVDHLGTNASAAYTVETDVLVVGAGNAGMEAAAAAKEAGANTILIEKEKTINLMMNNRFSLADREGNTSALYGQVYFFRQMV